MAGPLQPWIDKLRTLEASVTEGLDLAIRNELNTMADLQREQLEQGKGADNNPLTREDGRTGYSNKYKARRGGKGLQTAHVDLKVTGDFHEGIQAKRIAKNRIQLFSTDYKNKFLPGQYPNLWGFDRQRIEQIKEILSEALRFRIYTHFERR